MPTRADTRAARPRHGRAVVFHKFLQFIRTRFPRLGVTRTPAASDTFSFASLPAMSASLSSPSFQNLPHLQHQDHSCRAPGHLNHSSEYNASGSADLIDLTMDSSSPIQVSNIREAGRTALPPNEPQAKRRRLWTSPARRNIPIPTTHVSVDEVDLTGEADEASPNLKIEQEEVSAGFRSKRTEPQETEASRNEREQHRKNGKLSSLQCVVCMESITDITATACGTYHTYRPTHYSVAD